MNRCRQDRETPFCDRVETSHSPEKIERLVPPGKSDKTALWPEEGNRRVVWMPFSGAGSPDRNTLTRILERGCAAQQRRFIRVVEATSLGIQQGRGSENDSTNVRRPNILAAP